MTMAIGERIHFFRGLRGMTQKHLGMAIGFPEKSADVRIAQYESGSRVPKADVTGQLAEVLDVSPAALTVPDIDSYLGLMHTLFALEDRYGLRIGEIDGELCLRLDRHNSEYSALFKMFYAWQKQALDLEKGNQSKEDYDHWRYHYPEFDQTNRWAKPPQQGTKNSAADHHRGLPKKEKAKE